MPRKTPRYHALCQSRFYAIRSRARLAELFGLNRKTLDEAIADERAYSRRAIELTRNGKTKTRIIQEPRGVRRQIHAVVRTALSRIEPPDSLFCPVRGRSYVSNAEQHRHAHDICTLDIRDYFMSTSKRRVAWFFREVMHCSPDVAAILGHLLTVDDHLATGSTVSPIMSYYASYDMWSAINQIARDACCKLSIYMDDITISGDRVSGDALWAIKQQIRAHGLRYHKEKRYRGKFAEITGVIIKDSKLLVPNRQRKKAFDGKVRLTELDDQEEIDILARKLRGLDQQRKQVEGPSSRR